MDKYNPLIHETAMSSKYNTLIITITIALAGFFPLGCSSREPSPPIGENLTGGGQQSFTSPSDPIGQALVRLTSSGWDKSVATKVLNINQLLLEVQAEVNPANYHKTVKSLENIGKNPEIRSTVAKWPETAGILAESENPGLVAKTFERAGADYQSVANLYMTHADRKDSLRLASALQNNRPLICKLAKMGIVGPENLFLFDRGGEGHRIYERWLNSHIGSLSNTDEINLWVSLISRFGDRLLTKLNTDPVFRSGFESTYWPLFIRIVKDASANKSQSYNPTETAVLDPIAMYFSYPAIWDILKIKNRPEKIIQHSGLMGGKLLFGDRDLKIEPYPEILRDKVVELIVDHHEKSLQALANNNADLRFHGILRKKVDTKTLANVLLEIHKAGSNSPQVIKKYFDMSEDGIRRVQDGQPDGLVTWIPLYYTLYKVPLDYYYGVDPTTMDLIQATADPVLMFVTLGAGKTAFAVSKKAGEKIARKMAEAGEKNVTLVTLNQGLLKKVGGKVTEEALELAFKRGSLSTKGTAYREIDFMLTKTSEIITVLLKEGVKLPAIDITRPLQFAFQLTGGGRATWKRLTGLEARLFMRGDARVYIRLDNTAKAILGPKLGTAFNVAVSDLKLGMVMESPPVKEGVEGGIKQIALGAKESYEIWQKNASQWWLLNATNPLAPAH